MTPRTFENGEILDIHVGQLWNDKSALPFDFYKLHWCPNRKGDGYDPNTIGVSLRDTKIIESPYEVSKLILTQTHPDFSLSSFKSTSLE